MHISNFPSYYKNDGDHSNVLAAQTRVFIILYSLINFTEVLFLTIGEMKSRFDFNGLF